MVSALDADPANNVHLHQRAATLYALGLLLLGGQFLGIGLLGGGTEDGSGDIFLGFSTAQDSDSLMASNQVQTRECLPHDMLDTLYHAVIDATEEAILNAMVAAETMTGINGNTLHALPHDQVREILAEQGQLAVQSL